MAIQSGRVGGRVVELVVEGSWWFDPGAVEWEIGGDGVGRI